jgi:acetolactate synthase-1/2/3 large subunit
VHPVELCREVEKLLDASDAVLVSDGGEFGQWAQACLGAPRRIINGPAGAIGSALPFAAAAKLACPDARVVAMLGDGTFGFHMAELDTAVRHRLNYVAVIGNDATWNAEYQIQLRAYGEDRATGCELLPTRYGAVASALAAHGKDVFTPAELQSALRRAAAAGKPACVNVMIERLPAPRYD